MGEDAWVNDHYGRNFAGVPPRSSADYAFVQHMLKFMAMILPKNWTSGLDGALQVKLIH